MDPLPGLQRARTLAEGAMVDTCAIYRDRQGSADDVLDVTTGALVQPGSDQDPIYEGPCLLRTAVLQDRREDEGGAYVQRRPATARLPVGAPALAFGDILELLTSVHDPQLVGRRWRVLDAEVNTFAVTRKLTLEDQAGAVVR